MLLAQLLVKANGVLNKIVKNIDLQESDISTLRALISLGHHWAKLLLPEATTNTFLAIEAIYAFDAEFNKIAYYNQNTINEMVAYRNEMADALYEDIGYIFNDIELKLKQKYGIIILNKDPSAHANIVHMSCKVINALALNPSSWDNELFKNEVKILKSDGQAWVQLLPFFDENSIDRNPVAAATAIYNADAYFAETQRRHYNNKNALLNSPNVLVKKRYQLIINTLRAKYPVYLPIIAAPFSKMKRRAVNLDKLNEINQHMLSLFNNNNNCDEYINIKSAQFLIQSFIHLLEFDGHNLDIFLLIYQHDIVVTYNTLINQIASQKQREEASKENKMIENLAQNIVHTYDLNSDTVLVKPSLSLINTPPTSPNKSKDRKINSSSQLVATSRNEQDNTSWLTLLNIKPREEVVAPVATLLHSWPNSVDKPIEKSIQEKPFLSNGKSN